MQFNQQPITARQEKSCLFFDQRKASSSRYEHQFFYTDKNLLMGFCPKKLPFITPRSTSLKNQQ